MNILKSGSCKYRQSLEKREIRAMTEREKIIRQQTLGKLIHQYKKILQQDTMPKCSMNHLKRERYRQKKLGNRGWVYIANKLLRVKREHYHNLLQYIPGFRWGSVKP